MNWTILDGSSASNRQDQNKKMASLCIPESLAFVRSMTELQWTETESIAFITTKDEAAN
jgi:hypothetical protein